MKSLLILGALAQVISTASGTQEGAMSISPDPDVQARIRAVVQKADADPLEQVVEVEKQLRQAAEKNPELLVQQLLRYGGTDSRGDEAERDAAVGFLVIDYFRIPKTTIVRAVTPYIGTRDRVVPSRIRDVLRYIEGGSTFERPPDFSHYQSVLETSKDRLPVALISYMFDRSPETAFKTLLNLHVEDSARAKELRWSEHVLTDGLWKQAHGYIPKSHVPPESARELELLSLAPEWWARRYAAEILRTHREYRTPTILARLVDDKHPLVRDAMQFARKPDNP